MVKERENARALLQAILPKSKNTVTSVEQRTPNALLQSLPSSALLPERTVIGEITTGETLL